MTEIGVDYVQGVLNTVIRKYFWKPVETFTKPLEAV